MSAFPLLNWLALTVSILNTLYMLWIGLTILLNAERRVWGVWLAGGSLLLGAAFFVSHSIIISRGLTYPDWQFAVWWKIGLIPAHVLPYAWYVVMLWYAGYWQEGENRLRRRQSIPFYIITAGMAVGLGLLIFLPASFVPLYSARNETALAFTFPTTYRYILIVLGFGFAVYILACLLMALDAVRKPEPSLRMMGNEARLRARPWLVGTSVIMLFVTLFVTAAILWILRNLLDGFQFLAYIETYNRLALFDFIIESLILGAVLMLGQATVSYELFTGKSLPRRMVRRQWNMILLFGLIFGLIISSLTYIDIPPLHGYLFISTLLMALTGLISRRVYVERTRLLHEMRPFISSQNIYGHIVSGSGQSGSQVTEAADIRPAFEALCRDLLGGTVGYLLPMGPLATLVPAPLTWPPGQTPPVIDDLSARFDNPNRPPLTIDAHRYGGASWAIPLWSEHGLIGLFLLGNRWDDGLYAEEDIAAARAGGERLMDTLAGAELTRRLIRLQRQKMVESQLIDQKSRRILHDEVLPKIHTTLLTLSAPGNDGQKEAIAVLTDAHKEISDLLRQMPNASVAPVEKWGLLGGLKRLVEVEMRGQFQTLVFERSAALEQHLGVIERIPLTTAEIVYYAAREGLRNSVKHGRGGDPSRPLRGCLRVDWRDGVEIIVEDNGVGVQSTHPAPSPTGSGQGLTLHSTMLAVVGGQLLIDSKEDEFTRVTIRLPHDKMA